VEVFKAQIEAVVRMMGPEEKEQALGLLKVFRAYAAALEQGLHKQSGTEQLGQRGKSVSDRVLGNVLLTLYL